jgi:hypothetical protein
VQVSETPEAERARQELAEVHADERRAHFELDVEAMMRNQGDRFTSVSETGVRVLTAAHMREIFVEAFRNATYYEFDDLEAPSIHPSDDGTLAWMAVRLRVRKSQVDRAGTTQERRFVTTAIWTYARKGGVWLRTGSSGHSVDEPPSWRRHPGPG